MAKYLLAAILMGVFCTLCTGSAIPMWEFLSRGEKVSSTDNILFSLIIIIKYVYN